MKVEIKIDGKKIPANKFVQEIFAGMIEGTLKTLKKVEPEWKKVEIVVERADKK